MKQFWNDRYSQDKSAYGLKPNAYLKEKLPILKPGKILFPAEGEGRNAVFAAIQGWEVSAFDFSKEGKIKADVLAHSKHVHIDYKVNAFLDEEYNPESFDAICNIFVHFRPDLRTDMHNRLGRYLKKGGLFIMEVFSKDHIELSQKNPKVGGPDNPDFLYTIEEIKALFKAYEIIELKKEKVVLNEGLYHVGESSVIRFIGQKK